MHAPRPYSPASKYVRHECIGWDSPYGTIISAQRSAVQNGPAVEAHVVQDEALLRVDCRTQRPAMPLDLVALDGEAHAFRLRDAERPEVVARGNRPRRIRPVGLQRNRLDVHLLELEHAALVDVDVGDQALDRVCVAVVARVLQQVGDGARHPAAALDVETEAARGEDVDLDERDILHPAPSHGVAPAGVGPHRFGGRLVVLGRDGRAHARQGQLGRDGAAVEIAHELAHAVLAIDRDRKRAARRPRAAREPGVIGGLRRLLQTDRDEARAVQSPAHQVGGALELGRRKRLERMGSHMLNRHAATIAAARIAVRSAGPRAAPGGSG